MYLVHTHQFRLTCYHSFHYPEDGGIRFFWIMGSICSMTNKTWTMYSLNARHKHYLLSQPACFSLQSADSFNCHASVTAISCINKLRKLVNKWEFEFLSYIYFISKHILLHIYWIRSFERLGHAVPQLVEALRYKLEGHRFESWWDNWDFSVFFFWARYSHGVDSALIEMSTRDVSWGKGGRCIGLTTLPPSCVNCVEILEASTSWSRKGLSRPVMIWLIFIKKHQCYKNYLKSFVKHIWGLKSNQLRRVRWVQHAECIAVVRRVYRILVRMWEEETIEGPSYRLKNYVIMDLKETEYNGGADYIWLSVGFGVML